MGRIVKIGTAVEVVAVGVAVGFHKTPPPGPTAQQLAVKAVETYMHSLAYGTDSGFVVKRQRDGDWLVEFKRATVRNTSAQMQSLRNNEYAGTELRSVLLLRLFVVEDNSGIEIGNA